MVTVCWHQLNEVNGSHWRRILYHTRSYARLTNHTLRAVPNIRHAEGIHTHWLFGSKALLLAAFTPVFLLGWKVVKQEPPKKANRRLAGSQALLLCQVLFCMFSTSRGETGAEVQSLAICHQICLGFPTAGSPTTLVYSDMAVKRPPLAVHIPRPN